MSKNNEEQPKIWITVTEKINTGQYESLEIQAGYSKVYNKEDPKELLDSGIDEVLDIVRKKAKKIRKNKKK